MNAHDRRRGNNACAHDARSSLLPVPAGSGVRTRVLDVTATCTQQCTALTRFTASLRNGVALGARANLRSPPIAECSNFATKDMAMKKHKTRQRTLVLHKEAIQILSSKQLDAVAGAVESNTIPTLCLTVKTCASFEF